MSRQYYGIATDSPIGVGDICKVEDFRLSDDSTWEMKLGGDWFDTFYIFYINDDKEIIVIDPIGFLDIAYILRGFIIHAHQLKLTKGQIEEKGKKILKYMQTGVFKAQIGRASCRERV